MTLSPRAFLALLPVLPLLTACGDGVVHVDDDPFGVLRSAVWFEVQIDGIGTTHQFVASDVGDLCDRTRIAAEGLGRAVTDYQQALLDAEGDDDAICAAHEAWWDAAWDVTRRIYRPNGSFLTMIFDDREGDPEDPPERPGDYEVGDLDDPTFDGQLLSLEDNPFRTLRREGDCSDPEATDKALDELRQVLLISEGTTEVEQRTTERFLLNVDAGLADQDGDDRGDLEVRGRFDFCELELTPNAASALWYILPVVVR